YAASLTNRVQLDKLLAQARAAVARQDWIHVRELGAQAASLQRSLDADQGALSAADAVYGAPAIVLDPLSPVLASRRWSNAGQARGDTRTALAELAKADAESRDLYLAREHAIEALALPGAAAAGSAGVETSTANVEQQALQALEAGDAAA